ncbi:hypothetical protein J6590_083065 [Homalodisca vitripennis]|nr:hypothetical protein J6590_083065 [Homalodisca vitripennis]
MVFPGPGLKPRLDMSSPRSLAGAASRYRKPEVIAQRSQASNTSSGEVHTIPGEVPPANTSVSFDEFKLLVLTVNSRSAMLWRASRLPCPPL